MNLTAHMNLAKRNLTGLAIVVGLLPCTSAIAAASNSPLEVELPNSIVSSDPFGFIQFAEPHWVINNDARNIRPLPIGTTLPVPQVNYQWLGKTKTVSALLKQGSADAILVLKDGNIVYEEYYKGWNKTKLHQSWSVMKSFTATMIGQAIAEGFIGSVDDPVTKYVPGLANNGYNGVSIRNVLQMSSGVKWDENYQSPSSNIAPLVAEPLLNVTTAGLLGKTLNDFSKQASFSSVAPQGTVWNYSSLDSQVLGMVVTGATGRPLHEYLERKIWKPLGMETPAWLTRDRVGTDNSFAFLYATARDYARFGLMYLNRGAVGSTQVVPADWVDISTRMTQPIQAVTDEPGFSYGLQWWVPQGGRGDFTAWGIEGQHIYVDPKTRVVIVKLATDIVLGDRDRGYEDLKAFRAIADYVGSN